ncbi:uncharacterized protein (DUF58 family) [Saccharothrix tamanrassetensis]|uniref:Uncharacterized protein (DUF58 family) n=1 Tax=Saccharothrix tamanrassetensis TaxID=1051531 RepID=A0A841CMT0_9PSEU|nr:DUF58 domain-containing protein [Saccharothrix tamanrassetensis]MBB5958609.1 uncharacterized protein (DUF58 family) [Saccharothrix tamanrassetensis]
MTGRVPLTAAGRAVLLGTGVLLGAGVVLGYATLVSLAVAGGALLVLCAATVVVRPRVRMTREVVSERVSVGEPALARLVVRNPGRLPVPELLVLDRVGGQPVEVRVPALRPGGWRAVPYSLPTGRRGRLLVGPLLAGRRDPLGLFRRVQPQGGTDVLWVHPRVHHAQQIPVGTVPDYEGRAEASKAGTMSFTSLRDYVPGDDPRRIHWRSTARVGRFVVRDSVDTMEPTVTVVLDTRVSVLEPPAFEHAVEVAASIAQAAVETGRPVGVHVVGEDPASDAISVLDRLAAAESTSDGDPLRLLEEVDRAQPGGALVVVTGPAEDAVAARLAHRRRRFAPIVVLEVLPAHHEAPPPYRRQGMAVLSASSAVEAVSAWNHLVLGGVVG